MGSFSVPRAIRVPSTINSQTLFLKPEELPESAKNLIEVPGSIVKVYLGEILISPLISIGLQDFFQTISSLIIPVGI